MKHQDCSKWFAPHILVALDNGYVPYLERNVQYAQVYVRGRSYRVFWFERDRTNCDNEADTPIDRLTLNVSEFELPKGHSIGFYLWRDDLAKCVTHSTTFYNVGEWHRSNEWWVSDVSQALAADRLRSERRDRSRVYDGWEYLDLDDKLLSIVRKVHGFKTVDSRYIRVRKRVGESWWVIENVKTNKTATLRTRA